MQYAWGVAGTSHICAHHLSDVVCSGWGEGERVSYADMIRPTLTDPRFVPMCSCPAQDS